MQQVLKTEVDNFFTVGSVEETYTIIVIGDSGTGKTQFISRCTENKFSKDYQVTSFHNYSSKKFKMQDSQIIELNIIDVSCHDDFEKVYKTADLAILLFDVTSSESFDNIHSWIGKISNIPIILCGNKVDSRERKVLPLEIKKFLKNLSVRYIEVSANTGFNSHLPLIEAIKILEKRIPNAYTPLEYVPLKESVQILDFLFDTFDERIYEPKINKIMKTGLR